MGALMLVIGWTVTWGLGVALLAAVASRSPSDPANENLAWTVGCGWFVGAFLLTLWMRALALLHVPFGIASIGLPLVAATGLLAWRVTALRAFPWQAGVASLAGRDHVGWQRALWLFLLAWLALRYALLLNEIVWRPLFPWDAWMQWSTKARVWFELRTIVPFVYDFEWLKSGGANGYFDGAPHYPGTVPLLQVWSATLLGEWNDALVNLPWWLTGLAFALAIYGYFAREGFEPVLALVGTWLVVSLPIFEVHIALAGYADLAMSTYLTLAALWSLQAVRTRRWRDVAIAALFVAACVLIKNPGKIWIVTLVPGIAVAVLPRHRVRIAIAILAVAVCTMVALAYTEPSILGYRMHLDFDMPWRALFEAYFASGSWNLLWFGALVVVLLARRQVLSQEVAPYTLIVGAGLMFLLFGFAFTNVREWVEDQSTVNRAALHLAPLVIVWMLQAYRAWERSLRTVSFTIPDMQNVSNTTLE
jgi:hypothetical protein